MGDRLPIAERIPNGAITTPEQLAPDDLAYHLKVQTTWHSAQALFQHWAAHLAEKYRLGPQDRITETGAVVRGQPPAEGPR
jgi:hypothetical protein